MKWPVESHLEIFQLQMNTHLFFCTEINSYSLDLRRISHPIGGASNFSSYLNK